MKELQMIVAAYEEVRASGQPAALATVVQVKGSTYRRPGARMLMTQTGQMVGALSGGCLEHDVFERAQQVMLAGKPSVVKYDTTSEADIVWGLGLGCQGVVHVLIEPIGMEERNYLAFITECIQYQQPGVLVTVFCVEGQSQTEVGSRLMLYPDLTVTSDIADPNLTPAIAADAIAALHNGQSQVKTHQLSAGSLEVFIEVIQPPTPLVIFGAGYDAIPVAHFAKQLGWHVTVVDTRSSEATREQFHMADNVILTRPETALCSVFVDERTAAVVMTHNYLHDLKLLKLLLPSPARYLGMLGPKARTERLLRDLGLAEMVYSEAKLRRLYSPVGLDIGADTPEAIALAIVAEIQAVLASRSGGLLRDRKGPIHSHVDGEGTAAALTCSSSLH